MGHSFWTEYYTSAYKDIEFVGGAGMCPSKLFLTSLEDPENTRAKFYVQCAKGGITKTETEAVLETNCFCRTGYRIVTSPQRGCEKCCCTEGQYVNPQQSSAQQCCT
jgi:hypothetical protein